MDGHESELEEFMWKLWSHKVTAVKEAVQPQAYSSEMGERDRKALLCGCNGEDKWKRRKALV